MPIARLTNAGRQLALRAAKRYLRGRPQPLPDWGSRPHRVLFLRHDKIGDMVMSTGILRAIAESHPTLRLDVLASRSNVDVLRGLSFLNEVLVLEGVAERQPSWGVARGAWPLRSRRYDAVVDGLVLSRGVTRQTDMIMAVTGAPRRIGMTVAIGRPRDGTGVYTHPIAPPPSADANHLEYLALLAGPFGVAPEDVPHPALWLSEDEKAEAARVWREASRSQHGDVETVPGPRLLVNLSAGHEARRWGDAQFAAAIRHVRAAHPDATVVVTGDPAERASIEEVARATGASPAVTEKVRAAFAILAASDGVLTPDTSMAHAASAFWRPCITLMLPGAEPFTPFRTPGEVVKSPDMEMTSIPVADVVAALDRLFGVMIARRGAPAGLAAAGGSR